MTQRQGYHLKCPTIELAALALTPSCYALQPSF